MSKELIEKIARMEKELAEMKAELKASEELKPYDWEDKKAFLIDRCGDICGDMNSTNIANGNSLFYFDEEEDAEKFARYLKVMSCVLNLKKSLGCTHEFTGCSDNYFPVYDHAIEEWDYYINNKDDQGVPCLSNVDNAKKVIDYLNKNYPKGY